MYTKSYYNVSTGSIESIALTNIFVNLDGIEFPIAVSGESMVVIIDEYLRRCKNIQKEMFKKLDERGLVSVRFD